MLNQIKLDGVTLLLNGINVDSILHQLMPEVMAKLNRLHDQIENLQGEIMSLESSCERYENRIDELESSCERTIKRIDNLESSCERYENQIDDLETASEELSNRVDETESDLNRFGCRLDDAEDIDSLSDAITDDVKSELMPRIESLESFQAVLLRAHDSDVTALEAFKGRLMAACQPVT